MGVQTDQVNRRSFISFVCSPLPCLSFRKSDFHVAAGDAQGTDVEKSLSSIRRTFEPLPKHPLVICQFIFRRLSHRDAWNFMPDFYAQRSTNGLMTGLGQCRAKSANAVLVGDARTQQSASSLGDPNSNERPQSLISPPPRSLSTSDDRRTNAVVRAVARSVCWARPTPDANFKRVAN